MKRVILSVTGTVLGVVALLSYKTHSPLISTSGELPSAALPGSTSAAPTSTSPAKSAPTTSAGAPPNKSTAGSTPSSRPATTPSRAASVSYTGTAEQTRYGIVQVKVTVSGSRITDVSFVQLTAFDGRSQQINSYAAPILLQETLAAQSANINSVSGASYTSQGYVQSLQSALDQAGI
jgi:uncharacterized protein with FMN-binding domain